MLTRAAGKCGFQLGVFLVTGLWLHGQQLPLRRYTTAEGLPSNGVYSIASDSRGFLWFATAEGLVRFDGSGFTAPIAGLPHRLILQVLIGRQGNYWLATPGGLIRFRPDSPLSSADRIVVLRPGSQTDSDDILTLVEDRDGKLWIGTEAGLFRIDDTSRSQPRISEVQLHWTGKAPDRSEVTALAEDAEGAMWIGTGDGTLYRRLTDGTTECYPTTRLPAAAQVTALHVDRKGRLWVGRASSLERSLPAQHTGANGFERLSGPKSALPSRRVFDIFESRDGEIWVAIYRALFEFPADGGPVRAWNGDNGLPSRGVGALGQDRDGNLWMGTGDEGALKLATGGNLTYSPKDGIGVDAVISIAETLRGDLYIAGRKEAEGFHIAARLRDGFRAVEPRVPAEVKYFGWRPARVILQDRAGEWWLATSQGLVRYPRLDNPLQLAHTAPRAVYTTRDGLPSNAVIRLYEDRARNIWVSTESTQLGFWSAQQQKFVRVTADGVPAAASAFAEDKAGNVWIGDENGGIWRVRDGHAYPIAGPATRTYIRDLLLDRTGRLWIATSHEGLLRFDDPAAPRPVFRQYGYSDGLSSLNLYSIAEDSGGAIYLGTGVGIDRLEPDRAHIRHYTSADGIAPGQVIASFLDRTGVLWFGTNHGLTRFVPGKGAANVPPPVWISGLSVAGRAIPISDEGEAAVHRIEVQPGQEQMEFDFTGLGYAPGNILRYQYRLGGDDWSAPIESRTVHYGALAPGKYTFAVRAVDSDGGISPIPATVEFRIAPPLWSRTWFQGLLLAAGISGIVAVQRVRTSRLLEIERVRSGIALDLHDDIASNLAQITIFSEIALREAGAASPAREPLARIAETARDTVECISDIVWSIRPQSEGDLPQRIRRVGSDALTCRQIGVSFAFSEEVHHLILDPHTLRQVYLVYKEAVHNVVRHACALAVEISLSVDGPSLVLKVADNGKGFPTLSSADEGNGVPGMHARAASLGGTLSICSGRNRGTEVELRVPWKKSRKSRGTTWLSRVRLRQNW